MKYSLVYEVFDDAYWVFSRDIPNGEMKENLCREFLEKNLRLQATVKRLKVNRAQQIHDENAGRALSVTKTIKEEMDSEVDRETDDE